MIYGRTVGEFRRAAWHHLEGEAALARDTLCSLREYVARCPSYELCDMDKLRAIYAQSRLAKRREHLRTLGAHGVLAHQDALAEVQSRAWALVCAERAANGSPGGRNRKAARR